MGAADAAATAAIELHCYALPGFHGMFFLSFHFCIRRMFLDA
jgi:hypothetical protein